MFIAQETSSCSKACVKKSLNTGSLEADQVKKT